MHHPTLTPRSTPAMASPILVGSLEVRVFVGVLGSYEPEGMQDLRSGAHSIVLRCRALSSRAVVPGERVAIKQPKSPDEVDVARLLEERDRLLGLGEQGCPGVVRMLDHSANDKAPFIVLPWYDWDLQSWQKARKPSLSARLSLLQQAAEGLLHLHRAPSKPGEQWIHRDIKPQNILVRELGGPDPGEVYTEAVIADLSLLKAVFLGTQHSQTGAGTRSYAPPGALLPRAGAPPDPTVDGFSLAVVAFELFTGERPRVAQHEFLTPDGEELRGFAAMNNSERRPVEAKFAKLRRRPFEELVDLSRYATPGSQELNTLVNGLRALLTGELPDPDALARELAARLWRALRPMLEVDPRRRTLNLPELYDACQWGIERLDAARGLHRARLSGTHDWILDGDAVAGSGGQALIFRGRPAGGGEVVAIKLSKDSGEAAQFIETEVQVNQRVQAKGGNVPRLLDWGRTEEGRRFLVMEWFPHTLKSWSEECAPDARQMLAALHGVLDAVVALHESSPPNQHQIHRDLKPANFLVEARGDSLRVVLADFGCGLRTRLAKRAWLRDAFTPPYAPPEQWLPVRAVPRFAVDVYALGVLVYELLAGVAPDAATNRENALTERGGRIMALLRRGSERSAGEDIELRELSALGPEALIDDSPGLTDGDRNRLRQALVDLLGRRSPELSAGYLEEQVAPAADALLRALTAALDTRPEQRPQDARALRSALRKFFEQFSAALDRVERAAELTPATWDAIEPTVADVSESLEEATGEIPRPAGVPPRPRPPSPPTAHPPPTAHAQPPDRQGAPALPATRPPARRGPWYPLAAWAAAGMLLSFTAAWLARGWVREPTGDAAEPATLVAGPPEAGAAEPALPPADPPEPVVVEAAEEEPAPAAAAPTRAKAPAPAASAAGKAPGPAASASPASAAEPVAAITAVELPPQPEVKEPEVKEPEPAEPVPARSEPAPSPPPEPKPAPVEPKPAPRASVVLTWSCVLDRASLTGTRAATLENGSRMELPVGRYSVTLRNSAGEVVTHALTIAESPTTPGGFTLAGGFKGGSVSNKLIGPNQTAKLEFQCP